MAIQNAGATTPSEKFSARLSIAARATPASSRRAGLRPTILRHRAAAGIEAAGFQRVGDGADMVVQAALRGQGGGGEDQDGDAGQMQDAAALAERRR